MTPNLHRFLIITSIIGLLLAACGAAPSSSWSGLAVSDDSATIYVTQASHLYAVAPGGTKRWQFPADNSTLGPFYADPVIAGDTIYLTSYDKKAVYALNASDGLLKWSYPASTEQPLFVLPGSTDPALPADRLIAPVTVYQDTVYIPSADNSLYAITLDGTYKWKFTTGASLWGAIVPVEDTLLVPSMDHNLYAIDAATGSQTWVANLDGAVAGSPALSPDSATVYVGTLSDTLYAIDVETGATNWTVTAGGWVWGTPLVVEDTLYFGDMQGNLFSVNADGGSLNWKVQPGGTIRATPALVGESLIVVTDQGKVYSIGAASGTKEWEKELDEKNADRLLTNPVLVGDVVIIVPLAADQLIYAIDPANGEQRWTYKP